MNRTEMVMRRRQVLAFIRADPVSVRFERQGDLVKTAAGGSVRDEPSILSPQQARLVHNVRRYTNGLTNIEAGSIPDSQYLLLAIHTLDVRVNDRFQWLGQHYKITGIHPFREESTLCSVDFDGPKNREVASG